MTSNKKVRCHFFNKYEKNKLFVFIMLFINEMAKNIGHRTIDRNLWLSVASLYSRSKGNTANAKPMAKWTKDELLKRYISGLLIAKDTCPNTYQDILKHQFPLYGVLYMKLGGTLLEIKNLYNINNGTETLSTPDTNVENDTAVTLDNTVTNEPVIEGKPKLFKATPEWMKEKYDEMNKELFDNGLKDCILEVFTTGKGSKGNTLGWFCMSASNIYVSRLTRELYKKNLYGDKTYINYSNFVELAKPKISLNGNYSGDEEAILGTLVHEMCHYYDYMNGHAPVLAHGPSWKRIASLVSYKSKGRFSILRLATAEEMTHYVLDPEIQALNDQREARRQAKIIVVFIFMTDGSIRLVNATDMNLVYAIMNLHRSFNFRGVDKIITSTDPALVNMVYSTYNSTMRKYKFYTITDFYKNKVKDYTQYKYEIQYEK